VTFTVIYLLFAAFLLLWLAYWSFSALFPKSPPSSIFCLFARAIIGVVLVLSAIYVTLIAFTITI